MGQVTEQLRKAARLELQKVGLSWVAREEVLALYDNAFHGSTTEWSEAEYYRCNGLARVSFAKLIDAACSGNISACEAYVKHRAVVNRAAMSPEQLAKELERNPCPAFRSWQWLQERKTERRLEIDARKKQRAAAAAERRRAAVALRAKSADRKQFVALARKVYKEYITGKITREGLLMQLDDVL